MRGKHYLRYFLTASSGFTNFPEFVGVAMLDDVLVGYCDSNIRTVEPKQEWMKDFLKDNPEHLQLHKMKCSENHHFFIANINDLKQRLNQTGGIHILQRMNGCEWDDETEDITGFNQYGYDGEDFIVLDLKTLTWTAPNAQALITKHKWDADKARLEHNKNHFTNICPEWLKIFLFQGKKYLQKTVPPSVSLLQKSPSSPVSCHATGFYPNRAVMFWRKDGEEIHEEMDHGEILPNHDGTFQMRVDLNVSSVKDEDWSRYDCVFQFFGGENRIISKLEKTVTRSPSWKFRINNDHEFPVAAVIGVVVVLLLMLAVGVIIFIIRRRRKKDFRPAPTTDPDRNSSANQSSR